MNAIAPVNIGLCGASASELSLLAQSVWRDREQLEPETRQASVLMRRWEALYDSVMAAPTTSLQDVLVQICYANNTVGELHGLEMPRADLEAELLKVEHTLFSVVAFLSRHLNVDPEELAEPCANSNMNPFLTEAERE